MDVLHGVCVSVSNVTATITAKSMNIISHAKSKYHIAALRTRYQSIARTVAPTAPLENE